MNEYFTVAITETLVFILINAPMVLGAYYFSKKIACNVFSLKIATAVFICLLQSTVIFSLLGAIGKLSLLYALTGSVISGGLFLFAAEKLPAIHDKPACANGNYFERFMDYLLAFMLIILSLKTTVIAGTDTFLYHLFYPAMWLEAGRIYPITLNGLPHEYFPFAGEVMYGWLLLPGTRQPFYTVLQPLGMVMALLATAGMWQLCKIPQIFIKSGLLLFASICIIQENVCLSYTDALTGSFLVTGIAFMLIAFKPLTNSAGGQKIFAACAGTALGLAASIKYSGLIMAPVTAFILLIIFCFTELKTGTLKKNQARYWIFTASAFTAAMGFYLPNFLRTGNPFYPVKIPFLFSNGIDFERPPVRLNELWSFYVNKNIWDLNSFTALFYIGVILLIAVLFLNHFLRKKNCGICNLMFTVILSALVAESIMLVIYPAMTGARQIIPFLSVTAMLLPGVLYLLADKHISSPPRRGVYVLLIIVIGFCTLKNSHSIFSVAATVIGITLSGILAFSASRTGVRLIRIAVVIITFVLLFAISILFRSQSPIMFQQFAGNDNYEIVMHLREQFYSNKKALNIAASGYLFNYMLIWDMPGNRVFNIPINQADTTHPHEVKDLSLLREQSISYRQWLERLRNAEIDYLVIDLTSHQDFASNRDAELNWAYEHPETFKPVAGGNGIYLFKIEYPVR